MAKPKRRKAFETGDEPNDGQYSSSTAGPTGEFTKFLRNRGTRETFESVVIAIMLALLFRCFQAEAFIIPTGSMAVSLFGEHMDVECEQCGYQYQVGASNETPETMVVSTFCPICQHNMEMRRNPAQANYTRDHETFDGDRILANKFIYDFIDPKRWDVIIFKNPNNPKQNYIKRCIGLPNETVVIEYGDIYAFDTATETVAKRKLQRKPPEKIWHMLQLVDDTDYFSEKLKKANWPSRWNQHDVPSDERVWKVDSSGDHMSYSIASSDQPAWLRYRHIAPRWYEWDMHINSGKLPPRIQDGYLGELIADYYAYNHFQMAFDQPNGQKWKKYQVTDMTEQIERSTIDGVEKIFTFTRFDDALGMHWVGDLCVDAEVDIQSDQGNVTFQIVEGGAAFNCTIDLATGHAKLSCDDPNVQFVDKNGSATEVTESKNRVFRGKGKYKVRFANYDDRLALWVNKKLIKFGSARYLDYRRIGKVNPKWSATPGKRGDAEPIGIAASGGASLEISRLKVLRDIYYVAQTSGRGRYHEYDIPASPTKVRDWLTSPEKWNSTEGNAFFDSRSPESDIATYQIADNSYMPMGDNSPASLDARTWEIGGQPAPPYFDREYLSGRAMIIYWPHTWNWPPFFPNFRRMGFIH